MKGLLHAWAFGIQQGTKYNVLETGSSHPSSRVKDQELSRFMTTDTCQVMYLRPRILDLVEMLLNGTSRKLCLFARTRPLVTKDNLKGSINV